MHSNRPKYIQKHQSVNLFLIKMNIILIGNKDIDYVVPEDFINSFDLVCRVNRMTNWEKTRGRIDILLFDIWQTTDDHAKKYFENELNKDKFKQVKSAIYIKQNGKPDKEWSTGLLTEEAYDNMSFLDFNEIVSKMIPDSDLYEMLNGKRVRNSIFLLAAILMKYPDAHVTLVGIDYDRNFGLVRAHKFVADIEKNFLTKLLKDKKISIITGPKE